MLQAKPWRNKLPLEQKVHYPHHNIFKKRFPRMDPMAPNPPLSSSPGIIVLTERVLANSFRMAQPTDYREVSPITSTQDIINHIISKAGRRVLLISPTNNALYEPQPPSRSNFENLPDLLPASFTYL